MSNEYRPMRDLTDAELQARYDATIADKAVIWAAWEVVRNAGQTDLHCAEWQAVNTVNRALSVVVSEQGLREWDRALAKQNNPWDSPSMRKAWAEGPGRDAA